jgi:hypothetical protein
LTKRYISGEQLRFSKPSPYHRSTEPRLQQPNVFQRSLTVQGNTSMHVKEQWNTYNRIQIQRRHIWSHRQFNSPDADTVMSAILLEYICLLLVSRADNAQQSSSTVRYRTHTASTQYHVFDTTLLLCVSAVWCEGERLPRHLQQPPHTA